MQIKFLKILRPIASPFDQAIYISSMTDFVWSTNELPLTISLVFLRAI